MIISSKNDLLKEIDTMLVSQSIRNITLLYPYINLAYKQSPQNLGQEILSKLLRIKHKITIHSLNTLHQSPQQPYNLSHYITIKPHNNDNAIIKSLLDSIKESAKIDIAKQYQSLDAMLDDIKVENIDKISLSKSKDLMIEHIEKIVIESALFAEMIKADAKANITQLFNRLEYYIKQALGDKNKDYYKNIIKTIFGVIISIALGGGATMILLGISAALLSSFITYKDAQNNTYSYIKNPIIEFLSTKLAAYIQLINTQLLSCVLIAERKENGKDKIDFLDFSGFNLHLENTLLSCSQSIAFKGAFVLDENKTIIDIPNLLSKNAIILPIIKPSSITATMLHIRQDNIKDTPLLISILKEVKHFNHVSYIESPHFNSALLAEIFANKNKSYPNNHSTNMTKNYLIITNAPSKYNAKLTETITQHIIGNEIKDDINNRSKQELVIKSNGKQSSYNTTRDYSTYRIEINKNDDEPFMVQLSPFVRVETDTIKQSYENNENYKNLLDSTQWAYLMDRASNPYDLSLQDATFYQATQDRIDSFVRTYGIEYIQSFFKTPKEIEEVIKHEEQVAKDYLDRLQHFHNGSKSTRDSILPIFILFYGLCVFRVNFPSFAFGSEINKDSLKISCLNKCWKFKLPNTPITQALQKQLLKKQIPQNTELNKDFLAYLKEFMDTNNSEVKAYDDEIKQTIGIDLDEALEVESSQIKDYGAKYQAIIQKERTQEVFYNSVFKVFGIICPFMNFAHEDMIYMTKHCLVILINTLENLNNAKSVKDVLYKTLLTEIGEVLFLSYPTTIRVHIEVNGGVEKTAKNLNNNIDITNKIKAKIIELSKLNNKSHIQDFLKGFAQVELRRTEKQLALFEAKTAFILDSIDNNIRELNLQKLKDTLRKTMTSKKDIALIDNIIFTYNANSTTKAQSHFIGKIQAREIFTTIKQFRYNKIIYTLKANAIAAAMDIALDIALNHYFSTHYEAYQREFESIMHKRFTFYYDLPYALKRKENLLELNTHNQTIKKEREITYYPMIVCSKFLSFDLQSMIYGTELCTGGLTHHIGLAYLLKQNNSDDIQTFLLKKLLAYLIIDEKRQAGKIQDYEIHYNKQVPDYTFFNHKSIDSKGNIIDATINISLDNLLKYQVPKDSSLYKDFKARERRGVASAIDAYNEALAILADYKDYYFTNTRSGEKDHNKARRLLQCLNIIGQNNIRALYVGVNDDKPNDDNSHTPSQLLADTDSQDSSNQPHQDKKRPKLIGRLATTIIVEDGLWLG